jgi:hypothetical protein
MKWSNGPEPSGGDREVGTGTRVLLEQPNTPAEIRRPGRPRGSNDRATSFNPEASAPRKRTMSAEGKARIAAAQKKRWAAQKGPAAGQNRENQAALTKRPSKSTPPKSSAKVSPATAKKSTGAGTRRPGTAAVRKNAPKKTTAKKTIRPSTKGPAKQVAANGSEVQPTA